MHRLLTEIQDRVPALLRVAAAAAPSLVKVLKCLLVFVSLTGAAVLRRLLIIWFKAWRSPLRALPGPESKSLFLGNFDLRFDPENALPHEEWVSKYGTTFSYAGLLNVSFSFIPKILPSSRSETPSDDGRRSCLESYPQAFGELPETRAS